MKKQYTLFLIYLICCSTSAQVPFYFNLTTPGYEYISDVRLVNDRFYLIQNSLVNLYQGFADNDSYSDLIILDINGSLLEKYPLHNFRSNYHRIYKTEDSFIYMMGVYETDSCKSKLVFVKLNIDTKAMEQIASIDFCDRILVNLNIVEGLNCLFLDEYHAQDERIYKSIHIIDTSYNLTMVWDSLYWGETVSIDFARTGYVKASVGLYDFYDRNFNYRKQRYTNEGFLPIHETHTPFGKSYILEQGVQHNYSKPDFGLQIRLVDSNLVIKKKVLMVPNQNYYGLIRMPFFGGIDIQNENEIWSAVTFGHLDFAMELPSYYAIAKLDSNLNIICQHFLGYDAQYRLYGIRAFESGGAIIFGHWLKEDQELNEEDIFALRVGENCELPTVSTTDPNHPLVSISAYPNPTINSLTFDVNGFDPSSLKVEIIDVVGTILFSKKDLSYEIKVADMSPGQYFYRILEGDKILGVGAWVKQ